MGFFNKLFSVKPKGFIPTERVDEIDKMTDTCYRIMARFLSHPSEENRQMGLNANRELVEAALLTKLPNDLSERTIYLEEIVANMRLVRLSVTDRALLGSIGNLLIDSGIRKGRPIDQVIPNNEVLALKGKFIQYLQYSKGRF